MTVQFCMELQRTPKRQKKKKKNLEKEQTSHLFQNMLQNVSN